MRDVASRERYRIFADLDKNRLHLEVWGDVVDSELFAQFPEDWRRACTLVYQYAFKDVTLDVGGPVRSPPLRQ